MFPAWLAVLAALMMTAADFGILAECCATQPMKDFFMSKRSENEHGLSREDLRAPVKRQIRQECFFGCVVCGKLPYTYEHFAPPFKDATEHNPRGWLFYVPPARICYKKQPNENAG